MGQSTHNDTDDEACRAGCGKMDPAVNSAVGDLDGSAAEGCVLAWLQNLVWVFATNSEGDVVSAEVPAD